MSQTLPKATIFCDGGCAPNPGPGGWAALLLFADGSEHELSGADPDTTNNQMELTAACAALEALDTPHTVTMYVDSQYLRKGITEWMKGWVKRDWLNTKGEPVANQDLWMRLYDASRRHRVTWRWVRGHAGNAHNERVDRLATQARTHLTGQAANDQPTPPQHPPKKRGDLQLYLSGQFSWDVKAGGWGALIVDATGAERELSGAIRDESSPNRVVLVAAIRALEALADTPGSLDVYTDQEYLQKGMASWLDGWIKKGWRTASGGPVKNQDLWEALHRLAARRQQTISWHPIRASDPAFQRAMLAATRQIRW